MAFKGIKDFLGFGEEHNSLEVEEDEFYKVENNASPADVGGKNQMILFEPRAYSESTQIVDYLKKRSTVVVNLKRVTPDQAKRIVDFLTGSLYAMNGNLQKLGGGIFLCTPNNVNVEGKITDESAKKEFKGKTKEEDEFNW